jgi:class 3 adenylate cyclase
MANERRRKRGTVHERAPTASQQRFQSMLQRYALGADAPAREPLEAAIWKEYGARRVVLAVDMSGFSRLTQKHGIVHYLAMVLKMRETAKPIIEAHGGALVRFEADNAFAMFEDGLEAIRAAVALNHAFDRENVATADELDIHIACGIDYGEILVVERYLEFWGNAVNRASKLGEDLAAPGEILITREVTDSLPAGHDFALKPVRVTISGIEIEGHAVQYAP